MQKTLTPDNIAIFGGKFDPPHLGHQLIIFLLIEKYKMNHVWITPSFKHPFGYKSSSFEDRVTMCKLLAAPWNESKKVSVLTTEKEIGTDPVYTVDLLELLKKKHPKKNLHLVIGEDNWNLRDKWKAFERIEKIAKPIIIGRGTDFSSFFPMPDISSSLIRKMLENNEKVDHLLPDGMFDFIREKGLFK